MARSVFECQDSEGYQVRFETSEKEGSDLMSSYQASRQWLLDHGFTLVKAGEKEIAVSKAPGAKNGTKSRFDGQHCPKCGGPVWDNRPKKAENSTRSKWPDFSCRDKAAWNADGCQWAVWPGQYEIAESAV